MDGLSDLFSQVTSAASASTPAPTSTNSTGSTSSPAPGAHVSGLPAGRYPQPLRHTGPLPVRSAPIRNGQPTRVAAGSDWKKLRWSKRGGIEAIENDIISVIEGLKNAGGAGEDTSVAENDVLLVIDQPDLLLAATGPGMGVGGTEIAEMIMGLRQVCRFSSEIVRDKMS